MSALLALALLAAADDAALEARLAKMRAGDVFPAASQLPAYGLPWRVRQAVTAGGVRDCRAFGFLLDGKDAPPWVVVAVFCGHRLVRLDEAKDFVDWPLMARGCEVSLRLEAVAALGPGRDLFWLSERAVCDGQLLAEELAFQPDGARLSRPLKTVCADPSAGKTAPASYRAGFEGAASPKAFVCGRVRYEYDGGHYVPRR